MSKVQFANSVVTSVEELRAAAKAAGIDTRSKEYRSAFKALQTVEVESTQTKGDVVEMKKDTVKAAATKSAGSIDNVLRTIAKEHDIQEFGKAAKNTVVQKAREYYSEVAVQALQAQGEYPIVINEIYWQDFDTKHQNGSKRVGFVTFTVPDGYMEVSMWNGAKFEWVPMDGLAYSAVRFNGRTYQVASGARPFTPKDPEHFNTLTLFIKERLDGSLAVTLPKSKGKKEGQYFDMFRTKNIRWGKGHSDNNYSLEAALTAYTRFFVRELVVSNPINRHGIDEHCGSCQYMLRLQTHDGMGFDYENKANQKDIEMLAQDGAKNESWVCSVHRQFVDVDAVLYMNEQDGIQDLTYEVEVLNRKTNQMERQIRFLESGKYLLGDRPVVDFEVRKHFTKETCLSCAHFHGNTPKSEKQISKEKLEKPEGTYVPAYWTERAQADRQAIQVLAMDKRGLRNWLAQYPGEGHTPEEFRVLGLGGVVIYGDAYMNGRWVEDTANIQYVPAMEAVNEAEDFAAKLVDILYNTIRSFEVVTQENLDLVFQMVSRVDLAQLSIRMQGRFKTAYAQLLATIESYQ